MRIRPDALDLRFNLLDLEAGDSLIEFGKQLIKSGIYILAITDSKAVDPLTNAVTGNLPDHFVKFVIIR